MWTSGSNNYPETTWNQGESVNHNITFLQPDHFRLWYAYCERTWLAVSGSPAIVVVSMIVWRHPNLEEYMEFGYRLYFIKPPPVSFTSLEVLKLILAYTHTCNKIHKKNCEACLFDSSKTYSIDWCCMTEIHRRITFLRYYHGIEIVWDRNTGAKMYESLIQEK